MRASFWDKLKRERVLAPGPALYAFDRELIEKFALGISWLPVALTLMPIFFSRQNSQGEDVLPLPVQGLYWLGVPTFSFAYTIVLLVLALWRLRDGLSRRSCLWLVLGAVLTFLPGVSLLILTKVFYHLGFPVAAFTAH